MREKEVIISHDDEFVVVKMIPSIARDVAMANVLSPVECETMVRFAKKVEAGILPAFSKWYYESTSCSGVDILPEEILAWFREHKADL